MGRNKIKKILFGLLLSIVILAPTLLALPTSAQNTNTNEYAVLAPLPGVANAPLETTTLQKYLPAVFNLAIGLSAVFAVLMIVIGGFQYMSSDALLEKNEGKNRIWNSVKGLVFVIAAWLILYTINPKLLTLNLDVRPAAITSVAGEGGTLGGGGNILPGYVMTEAQKTDHQATKDKLWNDSCAVALVGGACPSGQGRITTNSVNPCLTGQTSGCTNLNDLPSSAITGLEETQRNCNCSLIITGGTEGGHETHGPGQPNVDLGMSTGLNSYVISHMVGSPRQTTLGPVYTVQMLNGRTATFLQESNPPHWHVAFP